MALSIVILSYRNPALLRLCLNSLVRAVENSSLVHEVIVVDNATSPETANVVRAEFAGKLPVRLIPLAANTGFTFGVNTGLRAATGDAILAMNQDIVVQPGTLEALASYLAQHPEAGLIGPRLVNFDGTHQASCFRFYTPLVVLARRKLLPWGARLVDRFLMRGEVPSGPAPVDWVSGAAFVVSRRALDEVGPLDEDLFHYFSDVDWAWRFWENGYQVVYFPLAALYHYLGRSSKGRFGILDLILNRATRWHVSDALTYFRKHGITGQRPRAGGPHQPHLISVS